MPKIVTEEAPAEAEHEIDTGPAPDPHPAPVPFVAAPQQNPPPSEEQQAWLRSNPGYVRISHAVLGRFRLRGTLTSDGHFISEDRHPILDGAGSFGVGVPL